MIKNAWVHLSLSYLCLSYTQHRLPCCLLYISYTSTQSLNFHLVNKYVEDRDESSGDDGIFSNGNMKQVKTATKFDYLG